MCHYTSDESSEALREHCLQALELFASKCPAGTRSLTPRLLAAAAFTLDTVSKPLRITTNVFTLDIVSKPPLITTNA